MSDTSYLLLSLNEENLPETEFETFLKSQFFTETETNTLSNTSSSESSIFMPFEDQLVTKNSSPMQNNLPQQKESNQGSDFQQIHNWEQIDPSFPLWGESANLEALQANRAIISGSHEFPPPLLRTETQFLDQSEDSWMLPKTNQSSGGSSGGGETGDIFAMLGSMGGGANKGTNNTGVSPKLPFDQLDFAQENSELISKILKVGTPQQQQELLSLLGFSQVSSTKSDEVYSQDTAAERQLAQLLLRHQNSGSTTPTGRPIGSPSGCTQPIRTDLLGAQMSTSRRGDWASANRNSPSVPLSPPPKFSLPVALSSEMKSSPPMSTLSGMRNSSSLGQSGPSILGMGRSRRSRSDGEGSSLTTDPTGLRNLNASRLNGKIPMVHNRSHSLPQITDALSGLGLGLGLGEGDQIMALAQLFQSQGGQGQGSQLEALKKALLGGELTDVKPSRNPQSFGHQRNRSISEISEETETKKRRLSEASVTCGTSAGKVFPKGGSSGSVSLGQRGSGNKNIKVRKESTSDRIAILRSLIAPQLQRGDTATVLAAVIDYLKNSYREIQDRFLSQSNTSSHNGNSQDSNSPNQQVHSNSSQGSPKSLDLRSQGYCLVTSSFAERAIDLLRK